MPKSAVRLFFSALVVLGLFASAASQTSPKPLRASEVLALEAGGALLTNIVHDINCRGLSFHPDADYLAQLKTAGGDPTVLSALNAAKVMAAADDEKPDKELLQRISRAAILMRDKRYDQASAELSIAIKTSFAGPETGFVMGELLRAKGEWRLAAAVYAEVLREDADFPEVHTKLSYVLYRVGDSDEALHEAKTALTQNPEDAEAHKNAGLALYAAQKPDAAVSEYREALRIKPDYAAVRYDLGLVFDNMRDYDSAIVEYTKAIALDPNQANFHTNLGNIYHEKGDAASAVREQREAKRLDPNDPIVRQNLASALMSVEPGAAIVELKELEKLFPDFEMCHVCLGRGLVWAGETQGAEAEFRKAAKLDPSDPEPHSGLGGILEKQKNYDAALEEFRLAERLGTDVAHTHQDVGRVLLAKNDVMGAITELKQVEDLSPSDWRIHDLYGQALEASGQKDLAIVEFKEAVFLDSKQSQVILALGSALEKKGDWADALEQDRKAALTEASANEAHQPGEAFVFSTEAQKGYKQAQLRFADHIAALKASGKSTEAAALEKSVRVMESSPGTSEKVRLVMQSADQEFKERRFDEGEKSYKEAVELAEQLPPGDENLIVALGRLAGAYAMRQDYVDAEATLHRQLAVIEKTFGPESPRTTDPLSSLGHLAAGQKNYVAAESYLSRALEINLRLFGENSSRTSESLRAMAGLYMAQSAWDKAEPYLLRAVKANEVANGEDDNMVLVPLWGLCDLYDRWGKPGKSQPCWHRATGLLEKQFGANSPNLVTSITNDANALRRLGRKDEADQLEQRSAKISQTAAQTN